jgi:quinol monooxygenase YgiN
MVCTPEKRDEIIQAIRLILGPVRVKSGCLSSDLYVDIENDNTFFLIEEWDNQGDLDEHLRSEHYRIVLSTMNYLCEPPVVKFNTVSDIGGLDVVDKALNKT